MRIIYDNIIESVSADNEKSEFPATNLLDSHAKKRWKAGTTSATVSASLGGGSNALALYNIQADSIDVTITGSGGSTLLDTTIDVLRDDGWGQYRIDAAFLTYDEDVGTHSATLDFSASSVDVAMGILFGGKGYQFQNPNWGLGNNAESHSIIFDLDNGYEYIFQRNTSDMPSFSCQFKDRAEYFNFLRLAKATHPNPIIVAVENMDSDEQHNFVWYGRMRDIPKGTLTSHNNYKASFELKEFL